MFSWTTTTLRGLETRRRTQRPSSFRPALEALEDRHLLATGFGFHQVTNLVSNNVGVALIHDPSLIDARGISLSPNAGTFWVSAHGAGVSDLYPGDFTDSQGVFHPLTKSPLTVAIPGGAPTGQVFNGSSDFVVASGAASGSSIFIFASDTGFITGWNPAVPLPPPSALAQVGFGNPGVDAFTGMAIANNGAGNFLYAADFRAGAIDVFDASFAPVSLAGNFRDPTLPRDFKPFNIQNIGGELFVTYARDRNHDAQPDGNSGFVSVFDVNGAFLRRFASRGRLDQPWGLALAPSDFGHFSNALLVGNHGDGRINAFDRSTGDFLGQLRDGHGRLIRIDGLWGLTFGNGVSAGDLNALYFSAGPDDGRDGLFGSIRVIEGRSPRDVLTAVLNKVFGDSRYHTRRDVAPSFVSGRSASLALLGYLDGDQSTKESDQTDASPREATSALDRLFGEDDLFAIF